MIEITERTKPRKRFPDGEKEDPNFLAAKRYGTHEMAKIWGAEQTFEYSLRVQGQAALTISKLHPDIIPPEIAAEIAEKASLKYIDPNRIRELEAAGGHDVIAINKALEEVVSPQAGIHINKGKTSADTTQPARGLQLMASLEVIAGTMENLRDIVIERSVEFANVPHMDVTHGYDALPTVLGRPFAYHAEMLQSGLNVLRFAYANSLFGKFADATGNHHSATALGINGVELQKVYCADLGLRFMDAPAQIPGLEFEADVTYAMARLTETANNLAKFISWGRTDDVNIFINASPKKQKGSSAMPHKDAKNGNPDVEEQTMSLRNYFQGNMMTALANCDMPYARNLAASANSRINLETGFKFADHTLRRLASTVYWIKERGQRCEERVLRSYGVVTAQQVMTYLTDQRRTNNPMSRSAAHDLMGRLATNAWDTRTPFIDILLKEPQVTSRLSEETLRNITNPLEYIGQSREAIETVVEKCYKKKTF
jgi:adenylosuccinate lyase